MDEVAFDERATFHYKKCQKKKSQVQRDLTGRGFPLMKVSLKHQPENVLSPGGTHSLWIQTHIASEFFNSLPLKSSHVYVCVSPPSPPSNPPHLFFFRLVPIKATVSSGCG